MEIRVIVTKYYFSKMYNKHRSCSSGTHSEEKSKENVNFITFLTKIYFF